MTQPGCPLQSGDVVDEKYRVHRLIGAGGMSWVLEARHLALDEPVAVKVLRQSFAADEQGRARFEREARAAFKIKSEHVARVIDVGRLADGIPYLVMEYLEGTDLGEVLARTGVLPVPEAVRYLLQACEAVAEAHELGIIHRDLKPQNLFRIQRRDGTAAIKLLDFGLSKVPLQPRGQPRLRKLTTTHQVMGTARYMSPEQWMSSRDVGPSTDIWSLGVVLFELVTGHNPFARDQVLAVYQAIRGGARPRLLELRPDAPGELEQVIDGCLQEDPARRYGSAAELAAALQPFARGEPTASVGVGLAAAERRALENAATVPALPNVAEAGYQRMIGTAAEHTPQVGGATGAAGTARAPSAADQLWAQIMANEALRPRRSRGHRWLWALVVIFVVAIVAAIVWSNRRALDPPADRAAPEAHLTSSRPGLERPPRRPSQPLRVTRRRVGQPDHEGEGLVVR